MTDCPIRFATLAFPVFSSTPLRNLEPDPPYEHVKINHSNSSDRHFLRPAD